MSTAHISAMTARISNVFSWINLTCAKIHHSIIISQKKGPQPWPSFQTTQIKNQNTLYPSET